MHRYFNAVEDFFLRALCKFGIHRCYRNIAMLTSIEAKQVAPTSSFLRSWFSFLDSCLVVEMHQQD